MAKDYKKWRVMRQDDNGNRFVAKTDLTQEAAIDFADEFTRRGHKQMYWAEPTPSSAC